MSTNCTTLLEAFLQVRGVGRGAGFDEPHAAAALASIVTSARRAWPQLEVDPIRFVKYLAERLPPQEGGGINFVALRGDDLFLVCACLAAVPGATRAFEGHCIAPLDRILGHLRLSAAQLDDVKQAVRTKLLVPIDDRPAKLAVYSGRGDLRSWVGVVATREALALLGACAHDPAGGGAENLLEIRSPAVGPELEILKEQYREAFTQAFAHATAELSPRSRNILRHHYLEGLTIDELGAMYGIHRSNAARRIAKARDTLLALTRRKLVEMLLIDRGEVAAIMRLVESRLDLSLRRALEDSGDIRAPSPEEPS